MKFKGSPGITDHGMAEFKIPRAVRRACSKLIALDFKRADFGLFRDLLVKVTWKVTMEGRGAQEHWKIFKDHLLQAEEQCILTKKKTAKIPGGLHG